MRCMQRQSDKVAERSGISPSERWFAATPADGLSEHEAARRLVQVGANRVAPCEREGPLERFVEELREPMILLLVGTGVLYSVWGELRDAITIFAIISLLIAAEIFNERRAERAIDALAELPAGGTVSVIAAGRTARVVANATPDRARAR
ncbi:MAG: hypothetical protein C4321_10785, partial [Chloroflexota bacterium]